MDFSENKSSELVRNFASSIKKRIEMKSNKIQPLYTKLTNGLYMPRLCYGTWQTPEGTIACQAVSDAIKAGYRHIDTAFDYKNEKSVGEAIRQSDIPREEIFLTTKLSGTVKTYEGAKTAIQQSLDNLGLEYIDLYIIHSPWPWEEMGKDFSQANVEVWRAMEEAHQAGKLKSIGLSNFDVTDIQNILDHCTIKPVVNQSTRR